MFTVAYDHEDNMDQSGPIESDGDNISGTQTEISYEDIQKVQVRIFLA